MTNLCAPYTEVKPSPCSHLSVIMGHSQILFKSYYRSAYGLQLCCTNNIFGLYILNAFCNSLSVYIKKIHPLFCKDCVSILLLFSLRLWGSACCILLCARYSRQELCLYVYLQSNQCTLDSMILLIFLEKSFSKIMQTIIKILSTERLSKKLNWSSKGWLWYSE